MVYALREMAGDPPSMQQLKKCIFTVNYDFFQNIDSGIMIYTLKLYKM